MAILDTTGSARRMRRDMDKLRQDRERLSLTARRAPTVTGGASSSQVGGLRLQSPNRPLPGSQPVPNQPAPQTLTQGQQQAPPQMPGQGTQSIGGALAPVQNTGGFASGQQGVHGGTTNNVTGRPFFDPRGAVNTGTNIGTGPGDVTTTNTQTGETFFDGENRESNDPGTMGTDIFSGPLDTTGAVGFEPAPLSNEELFNQVMSELLGADPRDTEAEKALAEEQALAALGQSIADSRGRLGAGGFGMSGALAGIEGGLRNQQARDLSQAFLDIDQAARDDAFDRQLAGAGLFQAMAGLEDRKAVREMLLEMFGQDPEVGGGGGGDGSDDGPGFGGGGTAEAFQEGGVVAAGLDLTGRAANFGNTALGFRQGDSANNPIFVDSPDKVPGGGEYQYSFGPHHYYSGADGKFYAILDDGNPNTSEV